jgi:hypothetical protein
MLMAEYVDIEKAIVMTGLRVILPPGVPGPWGEAVKGIPHVKKIPFTRVRHDRRPHNELVDRVLKRGGRWHGCGAA